MGRKTPAITGRRLDRDEIDLVWTIDRREEIEHIYHFEGGALVLKPEHYDVDGWPAGEAELYTPLLLDCFERGGWFWGLFDDARLIGAAVLDSKPLGPKRDQLQLKFLHVSQAYRKQGLGTQLFALSKAEARALGAKRLYISATPSQNTIDFYFRLGCIVAAEPNPDLFALEPKDIHLECAI